MNPTLGNQEAVRNLRCAALVRQTAPDAVSFVEVDEPWGTPGTLHKLAADCGYSWVFTPAFEFGSDEPAGGSGNALLTRLPIQAVQQWPLLWPPRVYEGSEPSEPRAVTLAALTAGSAPVWIGTTHLPRSDGRARDDALKRLMVLARGLGDHWVICRDFNTPASEWVTGYPPVTVGPSSPQPTYPAVRPTEAIDYCGHARFRCWAEAPEPPATVVVRRRAWLTRMVIVVFGLLAWQEPPRVR
jgi:endonuclease/exonuclease/phosphatase family metal-dependent hydrolase